jgi:oxygen-dependent protoporphyrinogen oxidase
LEDRLHGTNEKIRRTYVMRHGKLYDLPEGLTGLIPSRFGPMIKTGLISPWGKLRMGLDYFIPPKSPNGDESLAQFVERRLGHEMYERMIEPLMSGIYAGDGAQLSLGATFPQLRQTELDHGSLVKGMLATKKKAQSSTTPQRDSPQNAGLKKWPAFVTPETGLAEIVEALAARLKAVNVRLGTRVIEIRPSPQPDTIDSIPSYTIRLEKGETFEAEAVILATPAYATAYLVVGLDPELAQALKGIPYASTVTVSVAYPLRDIPRPLNGYGYIIPKAEGRSILACTWTSTKFPHRAPDGYGLIRAFIGRAGDDDVLDRSDEELLCMVRDELRETLGITTAPIVQRIFRWPKAMPQYTLGHLDRLAVIDQRLAQQPGLFVAGNAYRGIGLPDCIASGEQAADKVIKFLC